MKYLRKLELRRRRAADFSIGNPAQFSANSTSYADNDPTNTFATLLPGAPREGFLTVDMAF